MPTRKPLIGEKAHWAARTFQGNRKTQITAAMFIDVGETAEPPLQKVTGDSRGAAFTILPLGLAIYRTKRHESKPLIGQELVI